MYDVIIIGAGPAGMAAGVFASRQKLKVLVVAKEVSVFKKPDDFKFFTAAELIKEFEKLASGDAGSFKLLSGQEVINLEKNIVSFSVETRQGDIAYSRCVIIASGKNQQTQEGNTSFEQLTLKDKAGRIKVDLNMQSSMAGIFACGGVTESLAEDIFIISAEGAKAAQSADLFLNRARS